MSENPGLEGAPVGGYLGLAQGVHPKLLETPSLYDARTDELYELDEAGFCLIKRCDGTKTVGELVVDGEFLSDCLAADLLAVTAEPSPRELRPLLRAPEPSLRYLELAITSRCNLACRHCCLGPAGADDLPVDSVASVLAQFERMQGLRVLVTGGEPRLHPRFEEINSLLPHYALRAVLLTNGVGLSRELIGRLNVAEAQFSLDGMKRGHELLRGTDTFERTIGAMEGCLAAGIEVSVSTMIHKENLTEFDEMEELFISLGVREWGVDVPCEVGNWAGGGPTVPVFQAAPLLGRGWGASFHGDGSVDGCGLHLASVTPKGEILRCAMFPDPKLGSIEGGLARAWSARGGWNLTAGKCGRCEAIGECGGGCRHRAGNDVDPDPYTCALHFP